MMVGRGDWPRSHDSRKGDIMMVGRGDWPRSHDSRKGDMMMVCENGNSLKKYLR